MNIYDRVIDYLIRNRVSTTEVADVLGKKGVVPGVFPVNRGMYKVGKVKWVYAYDESNWPVHEQLQNVEKDCVIFVDTKDCGDRAIFGELVSKYLLLYQQSQAIVVRGKLRDAAALIKENWPIWCSGFTPVGCYNRKPIRDVDPEWRRENYEYYNDSIMVCDDCGVVIIPKDKISEQFLEGLCDIENQEDLWFDRLDHYKENTFQIVCQKEYLQDKEYMKGRNK